MEAPVTLTASKEFLPIVEKGIVGGRGFRIEHKRTNVEAIDLSVSRNRDASQI